MEGDGDRILLRLGNIFGGMDRDVLAEYKMTQSTQADTTLLYDDFLSQYTCGRA